MADKRNNASSHIGTHERRVLHWWACGGVAAFVFVLFAPPLFRGQIPWFMDIVAQFYPVRFHAARLLHAGEMPFWNRTYYLGTPLLANPQWGLLYPGNWPFLAWPNGTTFMLSYPIHIVIGALGCYWLTWELVRGRAAALTAAMFSVCNSWTWAHLAFGAFLNVTAWIPWVAWCVFRFARTGRWSFVALGAVLWALQLLGGAPQMAWYAALNYGLLGVAMAFLREEPGWVSSSRGPEEPSREFSSRSPEGAAVMEPRKERASAPLAAPWERASQEIPKLCKGGPSVVGTEPNISAAPSGLDNKTSRSPRALPWAILGRPFGADGTTQSRPFRANRTMWRRNGAQSWYSGRFAPLIGVVVMGVLGAGLAAVQIVPTALFTRECERAGGLRWEEIQVGCLSLADLWHALMGGTGFPEDAETTAFFGIIGVLLALLSLFIVRKNKAIVVLWVLLIADLLFCNRAIGAALYRIFPFYDSFHDPKRILGVAQVWICVLIGAGASRLPGLFPLMEVERRKGISSIRNGLALIAFIVGTIAVVIWNLCLSGTKHYTFPFLGWIASNGRASAYLFRLCFYGVFCLAIGMPLASYFQRKTSGAVIVERRCGVRDALIVALTIVFALSGLLFSFERVDAKVAMEMERGGLECKALERVLGNGPCPRFIGVDGTGRYSYDYVGKDFEALALPDLASLYGLEDAQGYDPFIPKPYAEWLNGINGTAQRQFWRHFGLVNPDAAFRTLPAPWGAIVCQRELLANLKKQRGIKLDGKVTNATPDERIVIYEPTEVAPYIALEENTGAFVEQQSPNPNDSTQRAQRAQSGTEVKILRKTANSLAVTVPPSAQARTLKIADILLPGWTAAIDGKRTAFGDGPLMRLAIPPSEKELRIELRYWPPGLSTGAAVSVLSLAVMAFICVANRRSPRWRLGPAPRATPE